MRFVQKVLAFILVLLVTMGSISAPVPIQNDLAVVPLGDIGYIYYDESAVPKPIGSHYEELIRLVVSQVSYIDINDISVKIYAFNYQTFATKAGEHLGKSWGEFVKGNTDTTGFLYGFVDSQHKSIKDGKIYVSMLSDPIVIHELIHLIYADLSPSPLHRRSYESLLHSEDNVKKATALFMSSPVYKKWRLSEE